MPEEGDVVTVTFTASDGAALKLGSLESCASGDNARGDLDVACMQGYAFVSFVRGDAHKCPPYITCPASSPTVMILQPYRLTT